MKILFIGDIVGESGRETVKKLLPGVKKEYSPNLIIANGENLAHGNGLTPEYVKEMVNAGINFFTSGNHIWGNKSGAIKLDDPNFPVIRPANYPSKNTPGRGYQIIEDEMMNKILIVNLLGQVFMKANVDSPFKKIDEILNELSHEKFSAILIDFHAETTSEKYALGFYLDGKVSAIIGTHTHVPTTDARIFPNGTAYITDVGMVGPYDSVIGVKKDIVINKFLTQIPAKLDPENEGLMIFSAVLVELDEKTKKALDIKHILKFT